MTQYDFTPMIGAIFSLSLLSFFYPTLVAAAILVGVGQTEITPPIGTPAAGYANRNGEGIHDQLLATALFIRAGDKSIIFCGVDHLGFTYQMVEQIHPKVENIPQLTNCILYIGSSHTHSGGGAYLDIPIFGESLAGKYSQEIYEYYIDRTVDAILQASHELTPAKLGIGYGEADPISQYRGSYPDDITPSKEVTVIKVTSLDDQPIAVLFNYAIHPTVLNSSNRLFSTDLVSSARDQVKKALSPSIYPIFFNGAQGDVIPLITDEEDRFGSCASLGKSLGATVEAIWHNTTAEDHITIETKKLSYSFQPKATPYGLVLPVSDHRTEMNMICFNGLHVLLTIPGELSCVYEQQLKALGKRLGYEQVSILGLTNNAHGYIILPESWRRKSYESQLSFGGEFYGTETMERAGKLLSPGLIQIRG